VDVKVPFVVRLDGTNDQEGRRLLAEAGLEGVHVEKTMLGAAAKVVELAGGAAPNGEVRTAESSQGMGAAGESSSVADAGEAQVET
jgi:hypothetical protein